MARKKHSPTIEADALFDPAKLAEEAVRSNLDPAVFDQIDEGDIVWPRNWFEWAHGSRFLNINPFAKQVEICTNLYAQFCPRCSDDGLQVTDEHWGHRLLLLPTDMSVGDIQDRVTFLEHGQCGQCGATKPELIEAGELNYYQNLAGVAGMRGSKSVTVGGLIGTYQLVRFLSLASPSKYFGLMANQMLHGTFTAITATQCYDTLWQAFKDRVDSSPWFNQYHEFLKREAARLGKDELYDVKDTYLWYGHKQLSFSFCGPDIRTIRGRTRMMSGIDEAGWFDVKAEGTGSTGTRIRLNAEETHEALIKCVYGDTLVQTADGLLRIDELVQHRHDGFETSRITVASPGGPRETTHTYYTAAPCSYSIRTRFGYELGGSPTHRIIRMNPRTCASEYATLATIRPGDYVAIMRGAELWPRKQVELCWTSKQHFNAKTLPRVPRKMTPALASILGHMVAEGCIRHYQNGHYFMSFTQHDTEAMTDFVVSMRKSFGINLDATSNTQTFGCAALMNFFNYCGAASVLSADKEVPWSIRQSPRNVVVAFLRALFDGDGGIYQATGISYTSASRRLIQQLQSMLLNFGVVSSVGSTDSCATNGTGIKRTYHHVRIFGENAKRFMERVGFISERKRAVVAWKSGTPHTNTDVVPYALVNAMLALKRSKTKGGGWVRCEDGVERRLRLHVVNPSTNMTYTCLDKLNTGGWVRRLAMIDSALASSLKSAAMDHFFWDVVEDAYVDDRPVELYDVALPNRGERLPHAFFGNGFVNHNSLRTIRSAAMRLRQNGMLDPPDAINADVSSPSSINDFIMRKLRESTENRSVCTFHYSTWEMNPNVPLESLRDEMRNPSGFERDYAAVPPLGANQFISSISAVEKCEGTVPQTRLVTWAQKQLVDEFGDTTSYLDVRASARDKVRPRLLAIDTGLTNNSFAITMMSWDRDARVPVVDAALECMPQQNEGGVMPVNFPMMYENVIERLMQYFWICLVVYDRWQSVDHVQRIRKEQKIESQQYTLKWQDFQVIRARVLDSSLRLPRLEVPIADVRKDDRPFEQIVTSNPVTHLALQILTVREGGRKVIKPLNGTDDLFRCLCLGITFILNPKYTPRFERYGSQMVGGRHVNAVIRTNRELGERQEYVPTGVGVRKAFSTGRLT